MARFSFLIPSMGGGGAEKVTVSLVNGAVRQGHDVDLILMSASGPNLAFLDPAVRVIDLKVSRIRNAVWPLVRYLKGERPTALQVSMWPLTIAGVIAVQLARTSTRLVLTDHVNLKAQYGGSARSLSALRASVRLFYPLASHRTAVSRGSAAELARLAGAPVKAIPNPIPPIFPGPPAVDGWRPGQRRLLSVGRLTSEKNQIMLIEALALISPKYNAGLVLLGEGELRSDLEAKAQSLGIRDRVSLPGYKTDPSPYYRAAELFVLSSNYEGFGNVLVEAMSAGLPVISTDCPDGPSEILEGGRYGALVRCGDAANLAKAIELALSTKVEPQRQKARAAVFDEAAAIARYLKLMLSD